MSETAKHTPGPWGVFDNGSYLEVNCGASIGEKPEPLSPTICSIWENVQYDHTKNHKWQNARLIAAAPDMAEALKWCIEWIIEDCELMNISRSKILDDARAALAKAGVE